MKLISTPGLITRKLPRIKIFSTFFSVISSANVDYNSTLQFDKLGLLQVTKNELLQSILLL